MNLHLPQSPKETIRPLQYRDIQAVECLLASGIGVREPISAIEDLTMDSGEKIQAISRYYWLLRLLGLFPNPLEHLLSLYVAEVEDNIKGLIKIAPFNRSGSTWRVEHLAIAPGCDRLALGSALIRHCLETVREARMWLIEVNVNDKDALALYRHNGFQPLAQMTYWAIDPSLLESLAQREPDLPNLLPVGNADAQLLCQLDTAAMPPLVRQVFDRHIHDFQTSLLGAVIEGIRQWLSRVEVVSAYVFEPQRKAAIGYFMLRLSRDGSFAHAAELTVHPAYTWLYPEILSQMARIAGEFPPQSLHLASGDYQPEREEYLEQIGATQMDSTLLMSRSVWHKIRESRSALEALQLKEMLPAFQRNRQPIPSRISKFWSGGGHCHRESAGDSVSNQVEKSQFPKSDRSDSYRQNGGSC